MHIASPVQRRPGQNAYSFLFPQCQTRRGETGGSVYFSFTAVFSLRTGGSVGSMLYISWINICLMVLMWGMRGIFCAVCRIFLRLVPDSVIPGRRLTPVHRSLRRKSMAVSSGPLTFRFSYVHRKCAGMILRVALPRYFASLRATGSDRARLIRYMPVCIQSAVSKIAMSPLCTSAFTACARNPGVPVRFFGTKQRLGNSK